jgi:hypothetical protein
MDEGWECHFRSNLGDLHDRGHDERKRRDVRGGCGELGGLGYIGIGDADGECRASGADDHDTAYGAVGDSGPIGVVYSGGDRLGHVDVSMEKGRQRHFRSNLGDLYDCGHDERKRRNLRGGCNELSELGDVGVGNVDGERSTGGTDDHDAAFGAVGDCGPVSVIHGNGDRFGHAELSMDERGHGYFWSDLGDIYDCEYDEQ